MTSSGSGSIKAGVTAGVEEVTSDVLPPLAVPARVQTEKKGGSRTKWWWVEVEPMFSISCGSHIRSAQAECKHLSASSPRNQCSCGQCMSDPGIKIKTQKHRQHYLIWWTGDRLESATVQIQATDCAAAQPDNDIQFQSILQLCFHCKSIHRRDFFVLHGFIFMPE